MEHEAYGKDTEWLVVDEAGRLAAEGVYHGFDQSVQQQIKDYLNPPKPAKEIVRHETTLPSGKASVPSGADAAEGGDREKPPLENWQKYMENGEYVRNVESGEEENHSFIDGNKNNGKKKHGRESVLKKLRQKQKNQDRQKIDRRDKKRDREICQRQPHRIPQVPGEGIFKTGQEWKQPGQDSCQHHSSDAKQHKQLRRKQKRLGIEDPVKDSQQRQVRQQQYRRWC